MSVRLMSKAWRMTLSPTEKLVLLALADWASDDGLAFPKQNTLAIKCSLTDRTVRKTLAVLRDEYALIDWVKKKHQNGTVTNIYTLGFTEDDPIVVSKKTSDATQLEKFTKQNIGPKSKKEKSLSHFTVYPDDLNVSVWLQWLEYKKTQFRFTFKSESSELIAINKLIKDSGRNLEQQALMVRNSISNGYKGLFGSGNGRNDDDRANTGGFEARLYEDF